MKGVVLGALIAIAISCGGAQKSSVSLDPRLNEVTQLWTQIRDWRREAGMRLDPPQQFIFQWNGRSVQEAARVCPDAHPVPEKCNDVCNLADDICDNAERICTIANELGAQDEYAHEKCASAKASCREAKQRCCNCSADVTPKTASAEDVW